MLATNPANSPPPLPRCLTRRDCIVGTLLCVATLAAYWPALAGGYLLDDLTNLTRPELSGFAGLWRIWFELGATQQYYPVLHSALWLQRTLWGDTTAGYHLVSAFSHLASAFMIVAIMRRLHLPAAWFAAALFALHPLAVESVAWISEQKNTLSTLLLLGAALLYLHFDASRERRWYAASTVVFVLAVLSKTPSGALPAMLMVILWWQRGRLLFRRDVRPLLPWFAIAGVAAGFTIWVEHRHIGAYGDDFALSFTERVLVASRGLCFYVGKLFWPTDLVFMYPRWEVDIRSWWQWAYPAAVAVTATLLWVGARKTRGPLAAGLIYAGALFPALGFVNIYWFAFSYVADHFAYVALVVLVILVAIALERPARLRLRLPARPLQAGACAVAAILAMLTWRQAHLYRDFDTLVRETVARNPRAWLFQNILGVDAARAGRTDEAITRFETARAIRPNFTEVYYNLGMAYERVDGRREEAAASYRTAIKIQPRYADAHFNLGNMLANQGRFADALEHYKIVVELKPRQFDARLNLGLVMENLQRDQEALPHFEAAVQLNPQSLDARLHYALGLANSGQLATAQVQLEQLLRHDPNHVPARDLLSQIRGALSPSRGDAAGAAAN